MDASIRFTFKEITFTAQVFFSFIQEPYYIFLALQDKDLVKHFGEELTIKTDLEKVLPKSDDFSDLTELRESAFQVVKANPVYQAKKAEVLSKKLKPKNYNIVRPLTESLRRAYF